MESFQKKHFLTPSSYYNTRQMVRQSRCIYQKLSSRPSSKRISVKTPFWRGLTLETVQFSRLGLNKKTFFEDRQSWGLSTEIKENGQPRMQLLPKRIIIPAFEQQNATRIKIRRDDWFPEDDLPKYVEVSGGLQRPVIYGDSTKPVIILESELDAILIQQFTSDLCCCMALGGLEKDLINKLMIFFVKPRKS